MKKAFFKTLKAEELYRNNYRSEREFRESVQKYIELESIPKTDLSGCTYFQTSQENIVSNDDGICFVNNELLLTLEDNFSQYDFENILLKYDAKIVGEIKSLNYYQEIVIFCATHRVIFSLRESDIETLRFQ